MFLTGDDITNIRVYGKLSKRELARKLGIDRKTLSNWENGVGAPNINEVYLICVYCNMNVLIFFTKLILRKRVSMPIDMSEDDFEEKDVE